MNKTGIAWCQYTWNVMHGCSKISEGCQNCYAEKMAKRLAGMGVEGYDKADPFKVVFCPDKLDEPSKVKKPSNIFIASMGDLFHQEVWYAQFLRVFEVICNTPQHNYLMLTKRAARMSSFIRQTAYGIRIPSNLYLGVTAENQQRADERIPDLIATGHKNLFVSLEPLLESIHLEDEWLDKIKWVIIGAESGAGKRECKTEWVMDLLLQCADNHIPVFYKQGLNWKSEYCKEPVIGGQQWLQLPDALKANVEEPKCEN